MRLANGTGVELELRVIGYQLPELERDEDDLKWLMIEIRAGHPRGRWKRLAQALLTFEVEAVARWLDQLSAGPTAEHRALSSRASSSTLMDARVRQRSVDVFISRESLLPHGQMRSPGAAESLRAQPAQSPSRATSA